MVCVNQTQPHCVNQVGKTQSKTLAERHGSGKAGEQHGNDMACVNRPLELGSATHCPILCDTPCPVLHTHSDIVFTIRRYCRKLCGFAGSLP
jgi:hypothetical protein